MCIRDSHRRKRVLDEPEDGILRFHDFQGRQVNVQGFQQAPCTGGELLFHRDLAAPVRPPRQIAAPKFLDTDRLQQLRQSSAVVPVEMGQHQQVQGMDLSLIHI